MALAGSAVGAALSKLKAELEGEAAFKGNAVKIDGKSDAVHGHESKDITHHYKMTHTETLEYEDASKDDHSDNVEVKKEKTKSKKFGCFGRCFGRKG